VCPVITQRLQFIEATLELASGFGTLAARVRAEVMCGIAGAIGNFDDGPERVDAQLDLLERRGPDARGIFQRGPGCIGQTRLAVIDLDTGDPPIANEDNTIGAVLNGEIYNFARLRSELQRKGHQLRTRGDTEVLAHLAEDVDPIELARCLDGMFALALWDGQRLVLGRDRLGKKPLYYWIGPGRFVFASEIKAVLRHPWVPRELASGAIDAYLTFGYVPSPRTFFAGVWSLPPGHIGIFEAGGTELTLQRYWSTRSALASTDRCGTVQERSEVRRLLTDAVKKRMVADVPMGAFLSGGIDSSSVVAVMAENADQPIATFTIGFEDQEGFDERPYARLVAKRLGTEHTEFVVHPDAAALVEKLVYHHDQPFGDSSALPTYLLSELTRRHVTVALCGDGGDEVFAGYERLAAAVAMSHFQRLPQGIRETLVWLADRLPPAAFRGRAANVQRFLSRRHLPPHRALLSWVSYASDEWRDLLIPGASEWGFDHYDELWEAAPGKDLLARLQALTVDTYLLDDLLVKLDRMAMAHGLEVRSPLLDPDLLTFGLSLSARDKVVGMSLKRVLKMAMADLLPAEILRRPKHGFGLPLDRWFRSDLRGYLEGTLGSPLARARAYVCPDALDSLLQQHLAGVANHGHTLWSLLTLEVFLQREKW
jgi:asparagine synthase (glutamine-hydrolysing)